MLIRVGWVHMQNIYPNNNVKTSIICLFNFLKGVIRVELNYQITLADGTVLKNLGVNGNCFVSKKAFNASLFTRENLATITIKNGENEYTYNNIIFSDTRKLPDGYYYLMLRETTIEDLMRKSIADVDYMRLMANLV